MPRRTTITFSNGMAAALFVAGLGRIVVLVKSDDAIWLIVALSAGADAILGFYIAERSRTQDPLLAFRKLASLQLLAGVSAALILAALYMLPVFRPVSVAGWVEVAGPVVALLFFPTLLISAATWLSIVEGGVTVRSSGIAMIGVIAGVALVWSPEALLTPIWGIASASVLLHFAGLIAFSEQYRVGRRWHVLGTVMGVTAMITSLLAALMTVEQFFVIGSV